MTIDTLDGLVAALRDSGLLDEEQQARVPALALRFPDPSALTRELERLGWLTPYQAEELLAGRGGELVLGQYVILSLLGQGGMGKVFKARHRLMKRVVALKVIRPTLLADPRAVQRFRREIEAVSRLSHPNIVVAFDANQVGNTHFLVMEYVEGTDLARLVKEHGPLPTGLACECIRQAALGLQHAYQQGMVHRDVKPANLLLSRSGGPGSPPVVKVLDMGLARLHAEEGDGLTHTGAVMGTPDYIAPEQASNSHLVDIRADLYSLGCTLYFLLAGEPPFPGGTAMEKLFKHQYVAPRPVEVRRPELPPAVAAIVARLLAKRPEERYQTPAELAEALAPLSVVNPDDEATTIYLPKPPPATEAGPGTIRASGPAGETMHPEGGATRLEGAAPIGSVRTPGDWSAEPVPYVEPPSPAGAVPAVHPGLEVPPAPAPPRRRVPVLLAGFLMLVGTAVVVAAVALPPWSLLWKKPGPSEAEGDTGWTVATPPRENGSEWDNTKTTFPGPRETSKADTSKEKPKATERQPEDTGKPVKPLSKGVVLPIPDEMEIKQAAFASGGKSAILTSKTTNLLGFCSGFDGNSTPSYVSTTIYAAGKPTAASAVATSGDGKVAFYAALAPPPEGGDDQNLIGLWRPPYGVPGGLKTKDVGSVKCLSVSENGRFVLGGTASDGNTSPALYLWDVADPREPKMTKVGEHGNVSRSVKSVGLSADGTRAVSCADLDRVRWWELKDGKWAPQSSWTTTDASGTPAVAISPSGNHILFVDNKDLLHLLEFDSSKDVMKLPKATFVKSLAVVEKDKKPLWVVCGDQFGKVSMWDVQTGQPITLAGTPHGPSANKNVLAVAVSPDYKYVYSLGLDNTIRRWLILGAPP